jgi:chromosome segregation ATPase
MDNPAGQDGIHIQDRAQRVVEGMRRAAEARDASQAGAVDLITEQMERLGRVEADLAATSTERNDLTARLRASVDGAEAERIRAAELLASLKAAHQAEIDKLVASAGEEIDRLKKWVSGYQADMSGKQADLERANARLTLESERLSEENATLSQTAEMLLSAVEENTLALQRQEAQLVEAVRRTPVRAKPEGSVVRLTPRPRVEGPSAEQHPVAAAG